MSRDIPETILFNVPLDLAFVICYLCLQDETVLARVKTDQRMARREGWMDNLAAALMGSRPMRKRSTTMTVIFLKIFFSLQVKHKE